MPSSLRVHLLSACTLTCGFCHHEGADVSRPPADSGLLLDACERVRDVLGTEEVHLTGGEPTLHPRLAEIVERLSARGFVVKLTTNAAGSWRILDQAIGAGLSGINVSLHAVQVRDFLDLMGRERWDDDRSARVLSRQRGNIARLAADNRVTCKVNTVVGRTGWTPAARVYHSLKPLIREGSVSWRLMDDLGEASARPSIARLLREIDAVITGVEVRPGSSATRLRVRGPDGRFAVKLVRRVRDPSMCRACPVDGRGGCLEGLYGLRLELDGARKAWLRRCIHRHERGVSMLALSSLADPDVRRALTPDVAAIEDEGLTAVVRPFQALWSAGIARAGSDSRGAARDRGDQAAQRPRRDAPPDTKEDRP